MKKFNKLYESLINENYWADNGMEYDFKSELVGNKIAGHPIKMEQQMDTLYIEGKDVSIYFTPFWKGKVG